MDEKKIMTELRHEGEKTVSLFESRPPIDIAGLSKMSETSTTWSPPHLFVASVEACFLLTAFSIAEKMRIKIKSYSSTAEGVISSGDGNHHEISEITIRPVFHLEDEKDIPRLKTLAQKAEQYCLVGRSVRTKVNVEF